MIIGCDFHTRFQQIAMMDEATGELTERGLDHESGEADAFYRNLQGPVRVGIEASGPIRWFERLLAELGHDFGSETPPRFAPAKSANRRPMSATPGHSRSIAGETLPKDMGSHTGRTRLAAVALASSQTRLPAHHVGQPTARAGAERGALPAGGRPFQPYTGVDSGHA